MEDHPVTSLTTMDMAIGIIVFQKAGTSMSHLHVNDWGGRCIAEQELIREIQRKHFCAFYLQNLYNRNDEKECFDARVALPARFGEIIYGPVDENSHCRRNSTTPFCL